MICSKTYLDYLNTEICLCLSRKANGVSLMDLATINTKVEKKRHLN